MDDTTADAIKITQILIPKIERVLNYDINDNEKIILIRTYISEWRE